MVAGKGGDTELTYNMYACKRRLFYYCTNKIKNKRITIRWRKIQDLHKLNRRFNFNYVILIEL